MCEKKVKKSTGQDSGVEFETEIFGTDNVVKEDMLNRAKEKGIITEKEKEEKTKDDLGLFEEKGEMATPAVGAVEGVKGVEAVPTVEKPAEELSKEPAEEPNVISTPQKTTQPQPPKQQAVMKQKQEQQENAEEKVQSSTDYFFNFLKKQGVFQQNIQPSVKSNNINAVVETPIKDRKDIFNIHRYKFVPNF